MENLETVDLGTNPTLESHPDPIVVVLNNAENTSAAGAEVEVYNNPREL